MSTLTKQTTDLQDIIFAWAFENPAEWHSGLINAMADIRLHACYEEARDALESDGVSLIPTSKAAVIEEAHRRGLLKTMIQKQTESLGMNTSLAEQEVSAE